MNKEQAIKTIESLYPPDDNELGREMLINELYRSWRSLPDQIIINLAQAMIYREEYE